MNIPMRTLLCGALAAGFAACSPPAEVQQLEARLELERATLDQQARALADLQERRRVQLEQSTEASDADLQAEQDEISSLRGELESSTQASADLEAQANASLRTQANSNAVLREQIDNSILSLETAVAETRDQMRWAELNSYKPEIRARLDELDELYVLQRQQIDDLRRQKVDLSSGLYVQAQVLGGAIDDQRANIAADAESVRQRISTLQAEMARSRSTRAQARMSLAPLSDEIRAAQNAYSEQQRKIQTLEASLQEAETRAPTSTQ